MDWIEKAKASRMREQTAFLTFSFAPRFKKEESLFLSCSTSKSRQNPSALFPKQREIPFACIYRPLGRLFVLRRDRQEGRNRKHRRE